MKRREEPARRTFLKSATLAAAAPPAALQGAAKAPAAPAASQLPAGYPRVFRGRQLAMIAFPLGGVAAGSISLGGRGQLRDWEIYNRPDKGNSPVYAFPCIWAQAGKSKAVARVLESRILPPYQGSRGLGSENVPGLARLASATFTGEYPLARIDFQDSRLPVKVSLEAFSPFIPLEPDDSGLPVAVLRYTVTNPGASPARCSIAFCLDNPVGAAPGGPAGRARADARVNEHRQGSGFQGLFMTNPKLEATAPMHGSFALCLLDGPGKTSFLRGWERGRWWNAPLLFWDDFTADGDLGPEPAARNAVGALCRQSTIAPGGKAEYTFLLAWHFPNRTPRWCGWRAPQGDEDTIIGNWYTTRFRDAWDAASYAAANLPRLEKRTRLFAATIRESTLPAAVKDAATANASTLATTTCFRTADGEFHGFEGVHDKTGCCPGNCTHVWNYETTTAHLFPTFARSLRKAAFGYSMDDAGAIHFRQMLPDGKARSGFAATDGQMGQLIHACLDWKLSGDTQWLRGIWPRLRKAMEFSWIANGWDGDKDGVMEGVQHNTYDIEFYGPNPQCGIYYLGGLRACEEMARAVGDDAFAAECRRLFENGSRWIDANLFNGEYYIQKVRGVPKEKVAPALRSQMGADDPSNPEYQMGEGCLADQLIGQYLADVTGLGPLTDPAKIRRTLASIYRYNNRATLAEHNAVQRIYALNDEPALLICDYAKAPRPRIPFPYFAEAWTGIEYSTAAGMMYAGLVKEGIEIFQNARSRHDGERRNPWDEPECGHHYARAMSAWSGILALSGFHYDGVAKTVAALPRYRAENFRCFWSTGTGWGSFSLAGGRFSLRVLAGSLPCRSCQIPAAGPKTSATLNGKPVRHTVSRTTYQFAEELALKEGDELVLL